MQVTTEWMRPIAWTDQGGAPQASIDLDANRLILLDRPEDEDGENVGGDVQF